MVAAFIDGAVLFGGAFPLTGSLLIERFGYSPAMAGLVVAGFGLGAFTYTRLAKTLVTRFGETRLLTLGGVLLALGLAGTAFAPNGLVVAAMQFWLGLAFYMLHGVLQARATEALPEARGTAVAAFAMALFFGQSIGALVFGSILHMSGYPAVFIVAAIATLGLMVWSRRLLNA
jgi:predicted MFS family arabinose efflux permease